MKEKERKEYPIDKKRNKQSRERRKKGGKGRKEGQKGMMEGGKAGIRRMSRCLGVVIQWWAGVSGELKS